MTDDFMLKNVVDLYFVSLKLNKNRMRNNKNKLRIRHNTTTMIPSVVEMTKYNQWLDAEQHSTKTYLIPGFSNHLSKNSYNFGDITFSGLFG